MKCNSTLALIATLGFTACSNQQLDESTYVLLRSSTVDSSSPALRAYFMGEGAQLNGAGCRELLQLANEGVAARHAAGETHLVKYECVSLAEARERGI
ncbi:hypothetical protein SAMN02745674_02937 [Lysobacter spongiicola DSM 21749]|uniref:Lipoprotein n=1 Tax=Lysobacter spongiicola DSM 21749 TaxID=1122188 RepID=A0A1T4SM91_9GAMM|nr:hypothetical protein SAMN02745674_02937 [Lysobacter spongiicola DSM 21749]